LSASFYVRWLDPGPGFGEYFRFGDLSSKCSWAWLRRVLIRRENPAFRQSIKSVERIGADYPVEEETSGSYPSARHK